MYGTVRLLWVGYGQCTADLVKLYGSTRVYNSVRQVVQQVYSRSVRRGKAVYGKCTAGSGTGIQCTAGVQYIYAGVLLHAASVTALQ